MFDQNGIVQVGSMIIRGVNDDGYLLSMPVANLNAGNYQKLATKTFDPTVMSKLRIGSEYLPDLETFVNSNPGYDGSTDPTIPTGLKFWGWYHEYGDFDPAKFTTEWDAYYVFGVRIKKKNIQFVYIHLINQSSIYSHKASNSHPLALCFLSLSGQL